MFDELKKRLSSAIRGLVKREETEIGTGEGAADAEHTGRAESAGQTAKHDEPAAVARREGEARSADSMVKLSAKTRIKGVFLKSVSLSDSDINNFLDGLKLSLLQADVAYSTTDDLIGTLGGALRSAKFDSRNIQAQIVGNVRASILEVLGRGKPGFDLYVRIKELSKGNSAPAKVLFLGPNGTGKTTTIAKVAHGLKLIGVNVVLSASDTFRAAAIEQTEFHAMKVGVPVVKSRYGADPASVAFDAIAYAKSHGIGAVLIDTAGRQETNRNLISEVEKIVRVAKPDITVYVGESTSGNAIAEQIMEFSKHVAIDGIILTKLDCDAKGGSALSITNVTGIPVLFFGTGESYDALVPYDPNFIVDAILPAAG
ncbi:MAG: AAA family ATPase [Candidatus Marsarchaeota archaeon]|jgi:fused signal recognition particle receptor|nr:AAA family ATPase [Candidatus Marsarchaeota archaeon]